MIADYYIKSFYIVFNPAFVVHVYSMVSFGDGTVLWLSFSTRVYVSTSLR